MASVIIDPAQGVLREGEMSSDPPMLRGMMRSTSSAFSSAETPHIATPIGRHRYFHKLYALDTMLDLRKATKPQIEQAMKGHVLASAELIGTYQKGDR